IQLQPKDKWINCFTMTNVTLPTGAFLGFSALTGDVSDSHDIISVRAESMRPEALKNYNFLSGMPGGAPAAAAAVVGASSLGFIFKLLLVAGVCGGLFVAYKKFAAESARRF
ncbi:hypothetical protein H4R19_003459, partial [Coemansia spiralis]